MMSSFQSSPRQGHLQALYHIFAYLDRKPKLTLYFDPHLPNIDYTEFKMNADEFKEYYRDAVEEFPPRMPPPLGNGCHNCVC